MEKSKKKAGARKTTRVVEPTPNKKDNKQLKSTILGIAMMVAAIGLGVGTYAYYQTQLSGTIEGTITPWSFLVNDKAETFTAELGDLYPGKTGSVELNLSAAASGLDVEAVISFSGLTNWPANLKLYKDAAHSESGLITVGTTTITETITAGQTKTVTIYYEWPYGSTVETGPTENQTASFNITVVGTQVEKQY